MRYDGIQVGGPGKAHQTNDVRRKEEENTSNNFMTKLMKDLPQIMNGSMQVDGSNASTTFRADSGEGGRLA